MLFVRHDSHNRIETHDMELTHLKKGLMNFKFIFFFRIQFYSVSKRFYARQYSSQYSNLAILNNK